MGQFSAVLPRDNSDWFFPACIPLNLIPEKYVGTYQTSVHKSHTFGQYWKPNSSRRESSGLVKAVGGPAVADPMYYNFPRGPDCMICVFTTRTIRGNKAQKGRNSILEPDCPDLDLSSTSGWRHDLGQDTDLRIPVFRSVQWGPWQHLPESPFGG